MEPLRNGSEELQKKVSLGEISKTRYAHYVQFVGRIEREVLSHPIIQRNDFTAWFKAGDLDREDLRHFLIQFSVFSNLFIEAQLKKTINAPNLDAMRASKEILLNELGVSFHKKSTPQRVSEEPEYVETEGTVEGGTFHFSAAHFEWLLRMLSHVGLTFSDVGKRRHGTKSTLFFCDELSRLYGSEDPHVGLGSSFGVENWAAAGFWKELIQGLEIFKKRECPKLPLAFFLWHDRVEDNHAAHTWHELEEEYFTTDINEDKFVHGAREMLDGVKVFWDGLNSDRVGKDYRRS